MRAFWSLILIGLLLPAAAAAFDVPDSVYAKLNCPDSLWATPPVLNERAVGQRWARGLRYTTAVYDTADATKGDNLLYPHCDWNGDGDTETYIAIGATITFVTTACSLRVIPPMWYPGADSSKVMYFDPAENNSVLDWPGLIFALRIWTASGTAKLGGGLW